MKFLRQDAHKKVKLGDKWRRPRGLHNKVRLAIKGYRRKPSAGFGTPQSEKHKINGEQVTFVQNVKDLQNAKGIVMLRSIGMKKKIMILEEGEKLKVKFGFDAKKLLSELKATFNESKKESATLRVEKQEKEKKASKEKAKSSEKSASTEKVVEEKDAKQEKKELDKKLIHTK